MALRTATKFSTTVLRTYRCRRCVSNGMILPAQSMMNGRYGRGYATSDPKNKKFDIPDEYTEEVFQALANNPPVMQAMHNVIESLNKRGIKLDREPNVTEMWKIMKDKDVMNALTELSNATKKAGIKMDHILKNLPWSEENTRWAQSDSADPSTSSEAIQGRIKKIREILKRPDSTNAAAPPKAEEDTPNPILEEDTTHTDIPQDLSLGEIQSDLRLWWKGTEEQNFYERLAKFKAKLGDDLADSDVYDFWIEEWSRKVRDQL